VVIPQDVASPALRFRTLSEGKDRCDVERARSIMFRGDFAVIARVGVPIANEQIKH
jgi:hypothetical protein